VPFIYNIISLFMRIPITQLWYWQQYRYVNLTQKGWRKHECQHTLF